MQKTTRQKKPTAFGLEKWLKAHVGKLWQSVLPELKQKMPAEDAARDRLFANAGLATRTSLRQGKVHVQDRLRGVLPLEQASIQFYVDPQTGFLCENEFWVKREEARKREQARVREAMRANRRELSDTVQLHRYGTTWVAVELAPLEGRCFDVLSDRNVGGEDRAELTLRYGKPGVFAIRKRELNYREMMGFGLLPPKQV